MKQSQFLELCLELLIDPNIALENNNLILALQNGDDIEVKRILKEEF